MLGTPPPMAPFNVPQLQGSWTAGQPTGLDGYIASRYRSNYAAPSSQTMASSVNVPNPYYSQAQSPAALIQALMRRK